MNDRLSQIFDNKTLDDNIEVPFGKTLVEFAELVKGKISKNLELIAKNVFGDIQVCVRNKYSLDSETVLFVFERKEEGKYGVCCPQFLSSQIENVITDDDFLSFMERCLKAGNKHILSYIKTMSEIDHSKSEMFLHGSEYFSRTESDTECIITLDELDKFVNNLEGYVEVKNIEDPVWGMKLLTESTKAHVRIGTVNGFSFRIIEPIETLGNNTLRIRYKRNEEKGFIKKI